MERSEKTGRFEGNYPNIYPAGELQISLLVNTDFSL